MTVARDSFQESATFTTTTPHTFTGPTPAGTPRSATLFIAHGETSSDLITGAVTYDGVAMTRVPTNGFAQDTAGEPGAVYAYHLGASIPTGAQTVSISHDGSATVKWAIILLDTASADTEIGGSAKLQGDQANPQSALDTGGVSSLRKCVLYSGTQSPSNAVVLSGMEASVAGTSHDFGNFSAVMGQQSAAASGSFTIGFTLGTEDVAFIALAIQELSGGTPHIRNVGAVILSDLTD